MTTRPIVIKKVVADDHDDHHGGAWKVAYADFMTAMMAFFLLLWLLGAAEEEQLRGLADYFTPSISESGGRGQGVLAGRVVAPDGILAGADGEYDLDATPTVPDEVPAPPPGGALPDGDPEEEGALEPVPPAEGEAAPEADPYAWPLEEITPIASGEGDAEGEVAARLDAVEERLEASLARDDTLADLRHHVLFERRPEGLVVQIVDAEDRSMFAVGRAELEGRPAALVEALASALAAESGAIAVSGHTDSLPFAGTDGYGNWELSSDRAHAARRALLEAGVAPGRVLRVAGYADTQPLPGLDPSTPRNRRISILLQPSEASR